jgi:four helix bundle protein
VEKKANVILEKTFQFSLRIIEIYKYLTTQKNEYIMSKQLLKSGTSIGANVNEAQEAQSKKDFISKCSISLKEARETDYWLRLLSAAHYLDGKETELAALFEELAAVRKIITAIINSSKSSLRS